MRIVYLSILFLASCSGPVIESEMSEPKPLKSENVVEELDEIPEKFILSERGFECYWDFKEKYAKADLSTIDLDLWILEQFEYAQNNGINSNNSLFNHDGPGPFGAEWNGDAGLFCMAEVPSGHELEIKAGSMTITDYDLFEKPMDDLIAFRIPHNIWSKELIEIKEEHYNLVYSEEHMIRHNEAPENSPLGVGEIIIITIKSKDSQSILHRNAMHIAFSDC